MQPNTIIELLSEAISYIYTSEGHFVGKKKEVSSAYPFTPQKEESKLFFLERVYWSRFTNELRINNSDRYNQLSKVFTGEKEEEKALSKTQEKEEKKKKEKKEKEEKKKKEKPVKSKEDLYSFSFFSSLTDISLFDTLCAELQVNGRPGLKRIRKEEFLSEATERAIAFLLFSIFSYENIEIAIFSNSKEFTQEHVQIIREELVILEEALKRIDSAHLNEYAVGVKAAKYLVSRLSEKELENILSIIRGPYMRSIFKRSTYSMAPAEEYYRRETEEQIKEALNQLLHNERLTKEMPVEEMPVEGSTEGLLDSYELYKKSVIAGSSTDDWADRASLFSVLSERERKKKSQYPKFLSNIIKKKNKGDDDTVSNYSVYAPVATPRYSTNSIAERYSTNSTTERYMPLSDIPEGRIPLSDIPEIHVTDHVTSRSTAKEQPLAMLEDEEFPDIGPSRDYTNYDADYGYQLAFSDDHNKEHIAIPERIQAIHIDETEPLDAPPMVLNTEA
ncbi:hypothetical protein NEFER03_0042 [Nematocida sp. LUAm3]|nr:hypothetical protein NEFER03_0042 [Nematocida sp. LUAm3]KAI5176258.1 hypothetical protein NEFER02_2055 [Nematocida sp. LUAm2]KAI5176716.1 hypothetical protein NEFER01_0041 [Nematocida sp. LUAm1]